LVVQNAFIKVQLTFEFHNLNFLSDVLVILYVLSFAE